MFSLNAKTPLQGVGVSVPTLEGRLREIGQGAQPHIVNVSQSYPALADSLGPALGRYDQAAG